MHLRQGPSFSAQVPLSTVQGEAGRTWYEMLTMGKCGLAPSLDRKGILAYLMPSLNTPQWREGADRQIFA